jgi:Arc/MetJ family transcription regulator
VATEKLSVTVDADVARRVKELAGRRGVSTFVDRALRHEVARADLRTLLDELEAELGPPDPTMVDEVEAMLANLEQRARRAPKPRAAG